jgi:hypothetical protein
VPSAYDQAVTALYQAPHESFVAERARLAAELKTKDKPAGARFAKLPRPSISAWAVNQLWWQAREAFEALFQTAEKLREGKLSAGADHRKALAKLAAAAHKLLKEAGRGGSDATLRRVAMTLSGLAAVGSFDPDPPGALSKDRDPPGFEAFGAATFDDRSESHASSNEHDAVAAKAPHASKKPHAPEVKAHAPDAKDHRAAEAARRHSAAAKAHDAAEKKRAAEVHAEQHARQQAKQQAKLRELESAVSDAKRELSKREHEHSRLQKELANAEREQGRAQKALHDAEKRLAEAADND